MKSAKLIALMLIAIPLMAASAAWGQGGNPSASTKESGAISGHGMTAVEQTAKDSGGSVELQIKTLHEQSRQAALKGDAGFLEKYLTDDYLGIGGDGRLITKDQDLQIGRARTGPSSQRRVHTSNGSRFLRSRHRTRCGTRTA